MSTGQRTGHEDINTYITDEHKKRKKKTDVRNEIGSRFTLRFFAASKKIHKNNQQNEYN